MRIGFISSYPPVECGIATYTDYLTDALAEQRNDVFVVCHHGGAGPNVFPAFDYDDADLAEKAFRTMIRLTPDVVHVQHEFGLFGRYGGVAVVPLILQFRLVGVPVVTTLHTVYKEIPPNQREILHAVVRHSDHLIVHEPYQQESLQRHFGRGVGAKLNVIPHGARVLEPVPNARAALNLPPGRKVILLIGYLRPSKNFEVVVDVLPRILERFPGAELVLAGKVRGNEHSDYRDMLLERVAESPVRDRIHLVRGQLPQQVFDLLISAADVVALPYSITSQSGILAHCLAFGCPVVVNSNPAMDQIMERCAAGLTCTDQDSLIEAIVRVLADEALATELSRNARRYVREEVAWPLVAERTAAVYRSLTSFPLPNLHVIELE